MNKKLFKRTKIINRFRKKINEINNINVEISQNFFVLSILYLFFKANLLKICE